MPASASTCPNYGDLIAERSVGWLTDLLDEHDLWSWPRSRCLRGWDTYQPGDGSEYEAMEQLAFHMADHFDCRYVQAIGDYSGTIEDGGDAFGRLCDRSADHGLLVGVEWVPFTNIYDAADAMALVERADRHNGGVCADIWHHQRGANDIEQIRAIPGEKVMAIQMSDGSIEPTLDSYYEDCLRTRVPPGEGEMDVAGFIAILRQAGADVPWDLEVCNDEVWNADATEWVQRCADGLRAALGLDG